MQVKNRKLTEDVLFLGYKSNPFKYLANSDIFILSSIMEGLPTVLLEALACEIPIISTNCETGPKEILESGKYGILTKVKDKDDLAKNMINLAENKELALKFSKLSLKRVKLFEIKRFIDKWLGVIKKFI